MDPKPPVTLLLAPAAAGSAAMHLPGHDGGSRPQTPGSEAAPRGAEPGAAPAVARFPSLDEHLVQSETREEMIRGRRVLAMPAHPPHADRHFGLDYVLGAHVARGYVGSTELLTRPSTGSDFATDTCIRRQGDDPATGTRYLEELAFEVVNEQSARDIREKAEDLSARGVRRVFAVFVKTGKVSAWSTERGAWHDLDLDETIEDGCLSRPLRVRALLDAAEADSAVARALADKQNPVIEGLKAETFAQGRDEGMRAGRDEGMRAGRDEGKAAAILAVLAARGIEVAEETRAQIASCRDGAMLDRWIARAAVARSAREVIAGQA